MNTHTQGVVPEKLHLTPEVFAQIKETIGSRKAETGGILGGNRTTSEVTHFCFDEVPHKHSSVAYTPNIALLNKVIKSEWKPQGIEYLGSVHSHPPNYRHPSFGDKIYARRILDVMELPYLLVPIVMTIADTGAFSLLPFAAVLDGDSVRVAQQDLIVSDEGAVVAERELQQQDTIPWEVFVLLSGVGLVTFRVIRMLQRYYKHEKRRGRYGR